MNDEAGEVAPELSLALTRVAGLPYEFTETTPPATPGPAPARSLLSSEADLAVHFYLVDSQEAAVRLWQELGGDTPPSAFPPDRVIGITGRLVFEVRYVGSADSGQAGGWRVAEVAGAIAGGE